MIRPRMIKQFLSGRSRNAEFVAYSGLGKNGRLGNQLWQIFSTVGLAQRMNLKPIFPVWTYSHSFSFPEELFSSDLPSNSVEAPLLARHLKSQSIYLQDLSLISEIDDFIKEWSKASPSLLLPLGKEIATYDLTQRHALHVRRGDYVRLSHYHSLPNAAWYADQISDETIIFTDDISWCRENFPGTEIFKGDEIMSFHAMKQCARFTISASSFSWWAAYLSGARDVVYPDPWSQVKLSKWNTKLFIPEYFEPRPFNF